MPHLIEFASPAPARSPAAAPAMRRGFFNRCPACGEGRLFRAFLKVEDECRSCGEELHHHRADDFPAYIVIALVGKIVVPLVYAAEVNFAPAYWIHLTLWPVLTLVLALALLQPVKGSIVALQWAMGMHGFEDARGRAATATRVPVPGSDSEPARI